MPATVFSPAIATRAGLERWRFAIDRMREGHRRREQGCLARLRGGVQDGLDVFREAHIEHLVRFIEHEHADGVERQRLAAEVVEGAARRGDGNVDAAAERADLLLHRRAAVERHDLDARATGVLVNRFRHLHRKLARRDEDETSRMTAALIVFEQPLDHRKREGRGLAGAGGGLGKQVAAGQHQRDGFTLDRCRFFVAERGERRDE